MPVEMVVRKISGKTIEVTQDAIDCGLVDHVEFNPIAIAIADTMHCECEIRDGTIAFRYLDGPILGIVMPRIAADWLANFNSGMVMQPFNFILEIPDMLEV